MIENAVAMLEAYSDTREESETLVAERVLSTIKLGEIRQRYSQLLRNQGVMTQETLATSPAPADDIELF